MFRSKDIQLLTRLSQQRMNKKIENFSPKRRIYTAKTQKRSIMTTEYNMTMFDKVISLMNNKPYLRSHTGDLYDAYSKKQVGKWSEVNRNNEFEVLDSSGDVYWSKSYNAYSLLMTKQEDKKNSKIANIFARYEECNNVFRTKSRVDSCR